MKKLGNIQTLRAFAAWSVVYYHYAFDYYKLKPESVAIKIISFYGNFGVDLFFVISGLIMQYSVNLRQQTAREFFGRRLVRIIPAYWFYTMILVLLTFSPIVFLKVDVAWTWKSIIESLLFIPDSSSPGDGTAPFLYVGWTLTYEMLFYLIFATCLMLPRRITFWCVILLLVVPPLIWQTHWRQLSILGNYRMIEFAAGMILARLYDRFNPADRTSNLIAIPGGISGVICLGLRGPYYHAGRVLSASFLVLAALYAGRLQKMRVLQFTQHLGDISYSTYLVHPIVIMLFYKHTGLHFSRVQEWLLLVAISAVVYGLSVLSFRYVENGPPKKWAERLFKQ